MQQSAMFGMFPNKTFPEERTIYQGNGCRKEEKESGKLMKEQEQTSDERSQIDGTGLTKYYL